MMSSLIGEGRHQRFKTSAGVFTAFLALALTLSAPTAFGARSATRSETAAMRHVWLTWCKHHTPQGFGATPCSWKGHALVSTVDRRFATADGWGEAASLGILKRPTKRSRRWSVWNLNGGGAEPCSHWYRTTWYGAVRTTPPSVVYDLRITSIFPLSTLPNGDSREHRC